MNVVQRLRQAIRAGEALTIIYNGGSNPGALRKISPISLAGDKVSAHCYSSNAVKSFAIDRIVLPDEQTSASAPTWAPKPIEAVRYSTLASLSEQNKDSWQALGWNVELSETVLSLRRYSKRESEPLKYPDITLTYVRFAQDAEPKRAEIRFVFSVEHNEAAIEPERPATQGSRERKRPWVVRAPNFAKAYSTLDTAAESFNGHAIAFSPATTTNGA